ncbi:MAG: hypothetical protein CME68_10255 [Halobacteriovoraceae bacterium]|nr:hypothetical protein [Halobacteriovoraceae bacterium]
MGPFLALLSTKFSDLYSKENKKKFPTTCFYIQHPKGSLLWGTGLDDRYANLKGGKSFYGGMSKHIVKKTLRKKLEKIGVSLDSITYVSVSHLHPDHTGNLHLFKKSKILLQKEEVDAGFGPFPFFYFFEFNHYKNIKKQIQTLNGDYDLFNDGTVTIIKAPGHTPGHQVLLLRLPNKGAIILGGDLYHLKENQKNKISPFLITYDKKELQKSFLKIENIQKKEKAFLWIQHEPSHWEKALKPPLYYD